MQVQAEVKPTGCCPPFDPQPFEDKELTWNDKLFVKDHVHDFLHVPLDMGAKVVRHQKEIDAAGARPEVALMLSEETSLFGEDIYIAVTKPVPGAQMATLSGTFLTRVYEGPFRDAGTWVRNMRAYVAAKGRTLEKLYLAYTTCPNCANAYGKNYVVLVARVAPAS